MQLRSVQQTYSYSCLYIPPRVHLKLYKQFYLFIQQYGPLLFQLIKGISVLNREECSWDPHGRRTVIVAFIFLLGFTQNFINSFTYLLSLYLQALSIKHYMLSFLYSFSLINSYKALNTKKLRLAKHSKRGPINSIRPFSTNNP